MHKIRAFLFVLLTASLLWTGCEDDNNEKDLQLPRLFRPTSFEASISGVDVTLTWRAIPGAESYTVDVSLDSLDYNSPLFTKTTEERLWVLKSLQGGQTYYARIKANSEGVEDDSQFAEVVIEVPEENLFNNFTRYAGVIDSKTASVAWKPKSEVTKLVLIHGDDEIEAIISEEELEKGSKTDIVLPTNNVSYEVLLMNGDNIRGKLTLKVEGDLFVRAGDDLSAAIASASAGDVIVLEGDQTFVYDGSWDVEAHKSLTFKGGPGLDKAVFSFVDINNSTAINQPDQGVDYIKFVNIELTGAPSGDMEAANSTWAPHFMNRNGEGFITKLEFDNCIISKFDRNLIRFRSTSGIDSLIINNSIVDFIGGRGDYHIVVTENDSYIKDIVFSNSTIYGSKRGLVRNNSNVPQTSFIMEYCTVNEMVDNGRYLLEMKSPIVKIEFSNCILGRTIGQYDAEAKANGINGASPIDGFTFSSNRTYALADFSQNLNESNVDRIIDLEKYSKSSYDVFVDPDNFDFHIKDAGFGGRGTTGDPRWW